MLNIRSLNEGEGVPMHVNDEASAVLVVLEGEVAFRCGDRSVVAGAGSMIFAPRGVPRTWSTVGRQQAKTLEYPYGFELEMPQLAAH